MPFPHVRQNKSACPYFFLFSLEDYCPVGIIGANGRIYPEPKRKFEKELNVLRY